MTDDDAMRFGWLQLTLRLLRSCQGPSSSSSTGCPNDAQADPQHRINPAVAWLKLTLAVSMALSGSIATTKRVANHRNGLPEEPIFRFVSSFPTKGSHLLGADLTFGGTRQNSKYRRGLEFPIQSLNRRKNSYLEKTNGAARAKKEDWRPQKVTVYGTTRRLPPMGRSSR